MASLDDFNALDIRAGTITASESFPEAVKPAYQLWIDFGEELGRNKRPADRPLYKRRTYRKAGTGGC